MEAVAGAVPPPLPAAHKPFWPAPGDVESPPGAPPTEAPVAGGAPPAHRSGPPRTCTVRPFVATKRALKAWRALGASWWVLETIGRGIQIPWTRRPPPFRARGYKLSAADTEWAKGELVRWLAAGYLKELTAEQAARMQCVVGAFVTYSAGKPRLVVDYRHPNAHMERRRFRYETLWELAPELSPGDHMISWDIWDACHHWRVRKKYRPFLAFTMLGRYFVPISMPFGLAGAPYTWTKVCRPVVARLREMGFRLTAYVDDFGGRPPLSMQEGPATREDARRGLCTAKDLLSSLGLTVHPLKGEREGTTARPLLGNVVDTRRDLFRLQPQRVERIETMATALLKHAAKHRRWVRLGTLRSFRGSAVSTTLSVPQARFRTQSLFESMPPLLREGPAGRPRRRDLRLPHQALADLRWWSSLTAQPLLGRALWPAPPDATMHTDASLTGWGAVWNGTAPARGFHAPARRHFAHQRPRVGGGVARAAVLYLAVAASGDRGATAHGLDGERPRREQRHEQVGGSHVGAPPAARAVRTRRGAAAGQPSALGSQLRRGPAVAEQRQNRLVSVRPRLPPDGGHVRAAHAGPVDDFAEQEVQAVLIRDGGPRHGRGGRAQAQLAGTAGPILSSSCSPGWSTRSSARGRR